MISSIIVVGVLTCAMFYLMWDLKGVQLKMQCCLIQELILYEFKVGHNSTEAAKNTFSARGDGTIDHSLVTVVW